MIQQVTTLGAYGGPVPLALYGAAFMNEISFVLPIAGAITSAFTAVRPSQKCQANDQGVTVVIQVVDSAGNPVNLRTATLKSILTLRPSGSAMPVAAGLYTNGFDGKMSFSSDDIVPYGNGLSEVGTWQVQGKITIAGDTVFTTVGAFSVGQNIGQ